MRTLGAAVVKRRLIRSGASASSLNPLIKPIDYRLFPNWLLAIGSLSHSLESNTLEQTFAIIIHSEEGFFLLGMKRLSFLLFRLAFFCVGPPWGCKGGFSGLRGAIYGALQHRASLPSPSYSSSSSSSSWRQLARRVLSLPS